MQPNDLLNEQIELEKRMTNLSVDAYRIDLERNKQGGTFGCTTIANKLLSTILEDYVKAIQQYLDNYSKGKAIYSTLAAKVITRLNDINSVAYLTAKIILNSLYSSITTQRLYKAIGQGIEDEYKMRNYKEENQHYYTAIQDDLKKRGAKASRRKNITMGVFNKRLSFHLDRWSTTEKVQTGMILTRLFVESTGLVEFEDRYERRKHYRTIIPTVELVRWFEDMNEKLEVMYPFFLPMVYKPKEWTNIFEGGYISPYLKRNKLIKNNDKNYLKTLSTVEMPIVYEAINHLQNTSWQINPKILETVNALWEQGKAIAGLPDREDEPLIPYPYPEKNTKTDSFTEEEKEAIKKWKRETYDIHKRNVQKRSIRILTAQILKIANQFKNYEDIWFPYQMDFRGRLYPIPVLLQPQGSDLAKSLLRFSKGEYLDKTNIKWLEIHGANMFGYDKESYEKRITWTKENRAQIKSWASSPLDNQEWTKADKPLQFLAFCFEYASYLDNPDNFLSYLPIQLDGTCNGLQHYSALLRDEFGGAAVNLINSSKPNDIYSIVAEKLEKKLNESEEKIAKLWLKLGINRKLTKRPVMVLPYGGTLLSCRKYIGDYLEENYSTKYLWNFFGIGNNPTDCVYQVSVWLSKFLWASIHETIKAAEKGMGYLRKLSRLLTSQKLPITWTTPAGLLVKQSYPERKSREVKTELYGSILKARINTDENNTLDPQRQVNGICPNFIHSLDAAVLMLYLVKCKERGINAISTVHDCYGTSSKYTDISAELLREAFVEVYREPVLENFTEDIMQGLNKEELPELPEYGKLDIEEVLKSDYFFN